MIYDHLAGQHTVGVYPLLSDDTCFFLASDFDEDDWREDARAFMDSCRELSIPAAMEISRSGNGAHVRIFFANPIPAREARQLGAALISNTCDRTRQLSLSSYDQFFPNQDTMPKGGFGNLIALPLQKQSREQGRSLFVDGAFVPYPDQWDFLVSIRPMPRFELDSAFLRVTGGRHPLDVAFVSEEDLCILNCGPQELSVALKNPSHYIALGELKGGIDPAGTYEHRKTARTSLTRIRKAFSDQGVKPHIFFVGAAIENSMADEI